MRYEHATIRFEQKQHRARSKGAKWYDKQWFFTLDIYIDKLGLADSFDLDIWHYEYNERRDKYASDLVKPVKSYRDVFFDGTCQDLHSTICRYLIQTHIKGFAVYDDDLGEINRRLQLVFEENDW